LVGEICASVAKQCNLRDDSQRVRGYSYPAGPAPVYIAAYAADCADTPKQPIWLDAYVDGGKIHVDLFDAKPQKDRSARYLEIQGALTTDFDKRLGVHFRTYDEVIK
jgi:hypothetical protein